MQTNAAGQPVTVYAGVEYPLTPREVELRGAAARLNALGLASLAAFQARVDSGWEPSGADVALGRGNDCGRPRGRHSGWGQL